MSDLLGLMLLYQPFRAPTIGGEGQPSRTSYPLLQVSPYHVENPEWVCSGEEDGPVPGRDWLRSWTENGSVPRRDGLRLPSCLVRSPLMPRLTAGDGPILRDQAPS